MGSINLRSSIRGVEHFLLFYFLSVLSARAVNLEVTRLADVSSVKFALLMLAISR